MRSVPETTIPASWVRPVAPSAHHGTWFASLDAAGKPNTKISKLAVMWILYAMATGISVTQTVYYGRHKTQNTKNLIFADALNQAAPMGGPGDIVEIDGVSFVGKENITRKEFSSETGVELVAAVERVELVAAVERVELVAAVEWLEWVELVSAVERVELVATVERVELVAVVDRVELVAAVERVAETMGDGWTAHGCSGRC